MAVPSNTVQTLTRTNMREDLENAIYSLDPVATPILSMAKKMTATAKYHEWNTDELANAASNKHVEGLLRAQLYSDVVLKILGEIKGSPNVQSRVILSEAA